MKDEKMLAAVSSSVSIQIEKPSSALQLICFAVRSHRRLSIEALNSELLAAASAGDGRWLSGRAVHGACSSAEAQKHQL